MQMEDDSVKMGSWICLCFKEKDQYVVCQEAESVIKEDNLPGYVYILTLNMELYQI